MEHNPYRILRPITEGAAALALAQLLGSVSLFTLPYGGDVRLGTTPIVVFAARWGIGPGALLGAVYGALGFLLRWDWSGPWQAVLVEDILALAALGTAGLFRGRKYGVFYGAILGMALRCACCVWSGVRFRPEAVPERFLNLTMTSPTAFYVLHDALWTSLNLLPCLALLALLYIPLRRYFLAEDLLNGDNE